MNDRCKIDFVNAVAVSGFANGVVNVAFTTNGYVPTSGPDGTPVVAVDDHVSVNLRMDLFCAQQVYDTLGRILADQVKDAKPKAEEIN